MVASAETTAEEQELSRARAQKYAEMYRSLKRAEARADQLEAKVLQSERETAQLREQVAAMGAPGSGDSAEVARLRVALDQAETQLRNLRAETSSGPFESAPRRSSRKAAAENDELRAQLAQERRSRIELAKRYDALRAQAPAPGPAGSQGEAMKQQLQQMLASTERDLAASRRNEEELRAALTAKGGNGSTVVVTQLKSENEALQARLDEEHQRNKALTNKLNAAARVTNLIFKMQSQQP